jgi:hypothetical protein
MREIRVGYESSALFSQGVIFLTRMGEKAKDAGILL